MNKITGAAVTLSVAGGLVLTAAPDSQAQSINSRATVIAKNHKGDPYYWGAAGPHRFDCSGLVYYSFKHAGKTLPRVAQAQYNHTRHISGKYRKIGDLVFFGHSSARITHVGIYVGKGKIVNANTGAYRGRRVVTAPISEYKYGGNHAYYTRP